MHRDLELLKDRQTGRISGIVRSTGARPGASCSSSAKAVVFATGGGGKAWRVTSNSWEYTGDGLRPWPTDAGAELMDMEFTQFHPTGMVWPLSVKGHRS